MLVAQKTLPRLVQLAIHERWNMFARDALDRQHSYCTAAFTGEEFKHIPPARHLLQVQALPEHIPAGWYSQHPSGGSSNVAGAGAGASSHADASDAPHGNGPAPPGGVLAGGSQPAASGGLSAAFSGAHAAAAHGFAPDQFC